MINMTKSKPSEEITRILNEEKQKASGTYRHDEILELLKKDFFNKCYVCEQKEPTSINIEHFKPHRGDVDLKFDWDNLYFSCAHCNNIKSDKYDDILDPANPNEDVEKAFRYGMKNLLKTSEVEIIPESDDEKTRTTAKFLEAVYNGTTGMKEMESVNIKSRLVKELAKFMTELRNYQDDEFDEEDRSDIKKFIKRKLGKKSPFTAFKRQIVRDEKAFYEEFKEYLD